ncbi:MAG: type 1 glutamine amidotransferase [Proteobacteria bacterium]|nr:type 1 glutamine amidotransferase [Pseudomonadota bacterium]
MKKTREQLKILLLQVRDDRETMQEEFYEFVQFSKLNEKQFTVLNPFQTPELTIKNIQDYDALFVGGSSDVSVLTPNEFPFVENCKKLIGIAYNEDIPVFASCFGFQLATEQMGGKIIPDKKNMEMGAYSIYLTDAAKEDALLQDTPSPFWAISGHKERASQLPPGTILLGYSEACPYHIFKFPNKPFYGFQFHPEVDTKDIIARISRYQDRYLEDNAELERVKQRSLQDTRHANDLLKKFVDRIILK